MSANDTCVHFNEKHFSKLPVKVPHSRFRENKKYVYFCNKEFASTYLEDGSRRLESTNTIHHNDKLKSELNCADKSTQIGIKNFYESCILEGLLNDVKRSDARLNDTRGVTEEVDPLMDIKNILLTTNDKLDLILSMLTDKKENIMNALTKDMCNRQKKLKLGKHRTRSESFKSSSHNSLVKEDDLNASDHSRSWDKCPSSPCITRLRPNPYFISPYFPPYYVKPISHYNYFKIFGPKYSDPDMRRNLWSPFMFLATNLNVRKLQKQLNRDHRYLGFNEEQIDSIESYEELPNCNDGKGEVLNGSDSTDLSQNSQVS